MALYATFGFLNSLSYLAKAGKFKLRACLRAGKYKLRTGVGKYKFGTGTVKFKLESGLGARKHKYLSF